MERDREGGEAVSSREDRHYTRYAVAGESSLLFLDCGLTRQCKVADLSLEGCRVVSPEPLPAGAREDVEVAFKVAGNTFRFRGRIRWESGTQAGIQFVDVMARRRSELADLIGELASVTRSSSSAEVSGRTLRRSAPTYPNDLGSSDSDLDARVERRNQFRYRTEASAVLSLVRSGSAIEGKILDLSAGGCRLRIEEKFALDLYTRVEIEFRLCGMPFRLSGVIQRIVKDNGNLHGGSVGVRFLDLSERKREQVAALIAEIEQGGRAR